MASGAYNYFKAHLMDATFNLPSDTLKAVLMDDSHAFNPDHDQWSEVSANAIAGTEKTLTNVTVAKDDTGDRGYVTADDLEWTGASFTAYHLVIYDDSTANDNLIVSLDFGGAQQTTNGTFRIEWDAGGILEIT